MKIRYVTGNLITGPEIVIAHGCNARGAYASGVAGEIREKLSFAYDAYMAAYNRLKTSRFETGEVVWAFNIGHPDTPPRIVANMITQSNYGRVPNHRYVSYEAVAVAVQNVNDFVAMTQDGTINMEGIGPVQEVGFPLVGSKLGGGKWSIIAEIIELSSTFFQPVVYLRDGRMPD